MNTNLYFLFWGDALFEKIYEKNFGGVQLTHQSCRKF